MKIKMCCILGILVVPILAYASKSCISSDIASLRSLDGVGVKIYSTKPENLEKYGLSGQVLQTDTELRLRQFAIKVLSEEESQRADGEPLLAVALNTVINSDMQIAAISLQVKLHQNVFLQRNPMVLHHGVTWETGITAICGVSQIKRSVREILKDLLDKFINDYLAANPKEQIEQQSSVEELKQNLDSKK